VSLSVFSTSNSIVGISVEFLCLRLSKLFVYVAYFIYIVSKF